ncbi:hypothetical protein BDN72DRAFT_956147 [Pluteus cervinus]|uniref:Uncharacterized protein n=1 Tax=Pluteus cervinus TaxID=181527 RepID=A0ACD3B6S7_9AGAR|nr:hypothetical protein BDN72DRAFT_956147 [Pluteus cervinus]
MKNEPELPIDLYRPIVRHLSPVEDTKTLLSVALTSKTFHQEAIQLLYHTLRLVWVPVTTQKKCLRTLSHSPKCADLVFTFTFTQGEDPYGRRCEEGDEYWEFLAAGLRALKNVTTLGFPIGLPDFAPSILLPLCSMPNLTLFMWPVLSGGDGLIPFFERHPNIRQMRLFWGNNPDPLLRNPHILPRLDRICGGTSALNALLPNRKVPYVEWIGEAVRHAPSHPFLESLQDVRSLTLGGYGRPWGVFLPDVAPYLQNLIDLLITESKVEDDLVNQIAHLPRLRCLAFTWIHGDQPDIEQLFWAGTRTLEVIAVRSGGEGFQEYRPRWVENAGGIQLHVSLESMGHDWELNYESTEDM